MKIQKGLKLIHWANGLVIHPNTVIEENVRLYQGVTIERADIHIDFKNSKIEGVVIKKGSTLCAGAKILCKSGTLVIGENTVVGANSVLTCSTGNNEIWAGVPARKISDLTSKRSRKHKYISKVDKLKLIDSEFQEGTKKDWKM